MGGPSLAGVRSRVGWLVLLFVAKTATGTVLRYFEDELARVVAYDSYPLADWHWRKHGRANRVDDYSRTGTRGNSRARHNRRNYSRVWERLDAGSYLGSDCLRTRFFQRDNRRATDPGLPMMYVIKLV